jgi:hypothetical protein
MVKQNKICLVFIFGALLMSSIVKSYNPTRFTQPNSNLIHCKLNSLNSIASRTARTNSQSSHVSLYCTPTTTAQECHKKLSMDAVRNFFSDNKKGSFMSRLGAMIAIIFSPLLITPKRVWAKAAPMVGKVKGWDLFGRVMHDDWLFTNRALTDPNLMKRSFLESIVTELPDVLGNFNRRKRINEISRLGSGLAIALAGVSLIGLVYKFSLESNLKRIAR